MSPEPMSPEPMSPEPMSPEPEVSGGRLGRELLERDPASRALGIELLDVGPGRAAVSMRVTAQMVQGHGTCHGGYLFLLADTAFAVACNTEQPTVAAGADVEFLAPVHEGDLLVATAVRRTVRGRRGVTDVTVRRGDEVVVEFRGRSTALAVRG